MSLGNVVGWTLDSYIAHNEAMREMDRGLHEERDRRYADVALEREKALRIKEEADKSALLLAREIQTYKDEKANELREQIGSERGLYATKSDLVAVADKIEATIKPLIEHMALTQGRGAGMSSTKELISWIAIIVMAMITIGTFVFKNNQPIYVPSPPGTLLPSTPPQQTPR